MSEQEWVTIKEAAKKLNIQYAALLRIINVEEAKGTIEVRSTPRDRRARYVEISQVRQLLSVR